MSNEAKKYTFTILGQTYTVITDETEEHVLRAVSLINSSMKEIAEKGKSLDMRQVAVLVALQYASKLLVKETMLENITKSELEIISVIERELQSSL